MAKNLVSKNINFSEFDFEEPIPVRRNRKPQAAKQPVKAVRKTKLSIALYESDADYSEYLKEKSNG